MNNNLKILFLEDNSADLDLMKYELKKAGMNYISESVETEEDFRAAIKNFVPDIIISDYSLPSFDGSAAFHIKQKVIPDIPFIFVSGTIGEENAVELIKNGVTDYALKDKLFSLAQKITRAIIEAEKKKEKKISDEKLKVLREKLIEIAFLQSHQVRVPVVHILGLFNLFNFDDPTDPVNKEVFSNLRKTTLEFDAIIRKIIQKTSEIEILQ